MGRRSLTGEQDDRRESEIQADVVQLYRAAGCKVTVFSDRRSSKQLRAVPDLYVKAFWCQKRWWHECKRYRAETTAHQREWHLDEEAAGGKVVTGGLFRAWEHLASLGRKVGGVTYQDYLTTLGR